MTITTPVTALPDEVVDGAADEVVVGVGAMVVTSAFPGIDVKVGIPSVSGAVSGLPLVQPSSSKMGSSGSIIKHHDTITKNIWINGYNGKPSSLTSC